MQGNIISKRNPYLLNKDFSKSKKLKYMTKLSNIIELLEPIQSSGIPKIRIKEFNTTFALQDSSLSMNIEPNTKYSIKLNFDYDGSDYNYITYTITSNNHKILIIEHEFSDTNGIKIIIEFLSSSRINITTDSNYKTGLDAFDILEINKINISENYSSYKIKSDNCLFKQGTDGLQKVNVDLPYTIYGYFKYRNNLFMVTSNGFYYCTNPYEPITLAKDNIYSGDTTMLIAPHTIKFSATNNGMLHNYNLNYRGKLIVTSKNPHYKFYSSSNGISWTQCSFEDVPDNYYFYCTWMSYVNGKYFMNTNLGLYYSTDAINWSKTDLTTKLNVTMINDDMILNWYKTSKLIMHDSTNGYYLSLVTYNSTGIASYVTCTSANGINWTVYTTDGNNDQINIVSLGGNTKTYLSKPYDTSLIITDRYFNYKGTLCENLGDIYAIFLLNFSSKSDIYTIITSKHILKTTITIAENTGDFIINTSIKATFSDKTYNSTGNVGHLGRWLFYIPDSINTTSRLYKVSYNLDIVTNFPIENYYTETIDVGPANYFNISQYNYSNIPLIKKYTIGSQTCMFFLSKKYLNGAVHYTLHRCTDNQFSEVLEFSLNTNILSGTYEISEYDASQFLIHFKLPNNNNKYYITSDGINFTELDSSLFPNETLGPLAYCNGICFTPPNSGFENKQYMYMHGQPPEIEGYTEVT